MGEIRPPQGALRDPQLDTARSAQLVKSKDSTMRAENTDTDKVKVRRVKASDPKAPVVHARKTPVRLGARFTPEERQSLTSLRNRYEQGRDQFSHCELARLRFLRWLHSTGRLES
jgi:hypothetical protein